MPFIIGASFLPSIPTTPPLSSILDHAATLPIHLGLQVPINVLLALSNCSFENTLCTSEQAAPRDRTGKVVFRTCDIKGTDSQDGSGGNEQARVMIPNPHIKTWHSDAPL